MLSPLSDDELMIEVQSGSMQAFETLVDRYQGMLVGFFQRKIRDIQLAEDLAQETLLKVFSQAWDFLPQGRFRAWMFRIAHNLMIDDYRRRSHDALLKAARPTSTEDQNALARLAGEFVPPATRMEHQEFRDLVDQLLDEIPEDQRETFVLHHFSDLSLPEVAEIMEVSVATSKSRLRLAREKLAEKLRTRGIFPSHTNNHAGILEIGESG